MYFLPGSYVSWEIKRQRSVCVVRAYEYVQSQYREEQIDWTHLPLPLSYDPGDEILCGMWDFECK